MERAGIGTRPERSERGGVLPGARTLRVVLLRLEEAAEPGRDGPKYFLKDYRQVLLADAYGRYNGVVAGNQITRAGCWADVRRQLIEAEKAAPEIAREAIALVRALYAQERQAKQVSTAERLKLRQTSSAPVLAGLPK